jgi:hypothetical protein
MTHPGPDTAGDIREALREAIEHLAHLLPGQAPIRDFVHHNTLHGLQPLPFPEALAASREQTGIFGYLPEDQFRALHRQGRISRGDLLAVLEEDPHLAAAEPLAEATGPPLCRRDVYLVALLHPLRPVTGCQLAWQIEELDALRAFQPDVPEDARGRLLAAARRHGGGDPAAAVADLWGACLGSLGLQHFALHPEDLLDLSPEHAERMLGRAVRDAGQAGGRLVEQSLRDAARAQLDHLLDRVGEDLTLRGLCLALTGHDLLEDIRGLLLRQLAAHLDLGLAAWHSPDRSSGIYAGWREGARHDLAWLLEDLPDWHDQVASLPADPLETVVTLLERLGLPQERWVPYLERLALEIPGWSGMFLWRHLHPGYGGLTEVRVEMLDYLAVRLALERLFAHRLTRTLWQVEPRLDLLRWHLRRHPCELLVRHALFNTRLPEYLAALAQRLVDRGAEDPASREQWARVAHLVWTWRQSPAAERPGERGVFRDAWRLFRLAQHLGLCAAELRALDDAGVERVIDCLDRLTPDRAGFVWLQAYERHYRDRLFNALVRNHGRGPWRTRATRPAAQLVFCMDDREEGYRRHLEEANPAVETFGAAGFFGIAMNWRGLDDRAVTPLCPIVVTPAHEVRETARPGTAALEGRHRRRRALRLRARDGVHHEVRRNLLSSALAFGVAGPGALAALLGKTFAPLWLGRLVQGLRARFDLDVPTRVATDAPEDSTPATPERPRLGFTHGEQADRVQGFLRTIGLLDGFAPLVVMMGHGSGSQNNPHLAAYDCGACSGRHGGPNARVFAAMANRPEIRALLAERGVVIPADTWFLGAEHNTCDESVVWYDVDLVPEAFRPALERLQTDVARASLGSAHERCRRFASAPPRPSPARALRHVIGRSLDFGQPRPELGHATNAAAIIGRRALSRGAFFDRRVFLISYDPTGDPEGQVVEAILLAAGPVGAGINLEYYFSTVSNERYGCGSKVTHNVAGFFGVMEGASSDLRTGLPRQMIEVHEPMRLQVVVEARTEVLARIYERQPPLQELVGNGWLLLSAIDPETGAITTFRPGVGFEPWTGTPEPLPLVDRSPAWYAGHHGPLPPALIRQPPVAAHG